MTVIPVVVLLAGALLTGVSYTLTRNAAADRYEVQYREEAEQISSAIDQRFAANAQVLLGGLGLWNVETDVTRSDWRSYVQSLQLPENYPGIQGVGYALFVEPSELDAHHARIRSEEPPDGELIRPDLFSSYTVHDVTGAAHEADVYTSIVMLEPFDQRNQNAFGLDMYSHPERRKAMDRAIESGRPALSGRVILVQEIDEDVQPGVLLYVPHYIGSPGTAADRRQSIRGFVYSPLRAGDLIRGILGAPSPLLTFKIFDGDSAAEETLLYDEGGSAGSIRRTEHLDIAGRAWTLDFHNLAGFVPETGAANTVLAGGAAITLLLFGLVLVQSRIQHRAESLAAGMTADLRRSEAEKSRLAENLAQSNRELEQFAYIASHDLKTPVRTIQSFLELLEADSKDSISDEGALYISRAVSGAKRMELLITDLLEYSRAGREPSHEVVSGQRALDDALAESAAILDDRDITVETVGTIPDLPGRLAEWTRVFSNLISNAVKYRMADAPLHVRIGSTDGKELRVWVDDNGVGIPTEHRELVFGMFKRLHGGDVPGSGMGLAICQRIVESYGGRIWIEDAPGGGTRFVWRLPRS